MPGMPTSLASIHIYPVKSLGGFSLPQVRLTDRGLEHDRRWMLIDPDGRFLSQRECPEMACLHGAPTAAGFRITDVRSGASIQLPWELREGEPVQAQVWDDAVELLLADEAVHRWFSAALQRPLRLAYMPERTLRRTDPRYATVPVALNDAFPCLIISQASLDELNTRLAQPVPMERFRPNLVISGGTAYQEDAWRSLRIGDVRFHLVKPCARCVIPNTDQHTGLRLKEPLRTLAAYRSVGNKVLFGRYAVHDGLGLLHVGAQVRSMG
jgi:uncharacterized protein YcbX